MDAPTFEELFPEIPPGERDEARARLDRYVALAIRIADRIASEQAADAKPSLTSPPPSPTMKGERSKQTKPTNNG